MDLSEGTPQPGALEAEIAALKDQVAQLRKTLKTECSTILSSDSIRSKIQSTQSASSASSSSSRHSRKSRRQPPPTKLQTRSTQQHAYVQQCLYRISTAATAFKIRDPDPNAVDGGHVLGLRFEVMSRGQFLRPYYVMLNRPFANSSHLRVHRHTVPPAVPLAGIAARHLPSPKPEAETPIEQDLELFVRTLRRQIMRYHNRLGTTADLRRAMGLHEVNSRIASASSVVEVGIADIEAKQIKLTWADGRTGRVVMDDDGRAIKVMVFGKQGRDWDATRELFGGFERVEDVAQKLQELKDR